ncbi:hypothetical protein [Lysinibacillus sphaericus]|uniref:Helix-turn-helix domain-containing protein n=1 Tax=Lysinibacillus sphaericus TaxID=1421 RepID=A0A6H0A0H8_LYSSH|nr:hypothetical protein [Lysinibacillus sphaericus]QIS31257.1 helix-turn-helix domain-containing protein [Lysinibacillus sphaericus]QPA61360.1 hypothetical protein INQ55_23815 [Lysinibacillus sphaericus]
MAIIQIIKKLISWLFIFILLYLSIDGMYIISTAISEVPDKKTAIESIRAIVASLLALTIALMFIFFYPIRMFRSSKEGFLIIFMYLLLLSFAFVGNLEITFYTGLTYLVLNLVLDITLTFVQKNRDKKLEPKNNNTVKVPN